MTPSRLIWCCIGALLLVSVSALEVQVECAEDVCLAPEIPAREDLDLECSTFRHPVLAVSHGPGPLWLLEKGFGGMDKHSQPAKNLKSTLAKIYPEYAPLPKRILFISAHWESETSGAFEISITKKPEMIYDYYGFPDESYKIVYGAKGDPEFAPRVQTLLQEARIKTRLVHRGYDHGVFVPMSLIRPEADIPILTMSINDRLGAEAHFKLGKALAPLRDEDTLIICSGQATHNLNAGFHLNQPVSKWASTFQSWLDNVFTTESGLDYDERSQQLTAWRTKAPSAKQAHPTPDHFTPFLIAAGAGMLEDLPGGDKIFGGWGTGQLSFASYVWGLGNYTPTTSLT